MKPIILLLSLTFLSACHDSKVEEYKTQIQTLKEVNEQLKGEVQILKQQKEAFMEKCERLLEECKNEHEG